MNVIVKGGKKYQRAWVEDITQFCLKKLVSTRMYNLLEVTVEMRKDLFHKEGLYGDAQPDDWGEARPKFFTVRIDNSLRLRPLLQSLCHELVHVSQYAKNEMREVTIKGEMCTRFKAKYYPHEQTPYWEQPWEVEANGLERGMFEMWATDLGIFDDERNNNWAYLDEYPTGYWEKIWSQDKTEPRQKKLDFGEDLSDNICMVNETTSGAH